MKSQVWTFLISSVILQKATNGEDFSCSTHCGRADEQPENASNFADKGKVSDKAVRIVNGWNAKPRPWMVLIRAVNPEDEEDFETCGGTIINKRYILTAAHCVCYQHSRTTPCEDGKIEYDAREVIQPFVGINDANVREVLPRNRDLYRLEVEEIKIHPGWKGNGLSFPDLALLKTTKDIKFKDSGDRNAVLPICLPEVDELVIHDRLGYVAGWGFTRDEECVTNNYGPNRHARCRFPFIYKGYEMSSCLKAETPSSANRLCRQFQMVMGEAEMPQQGQSVTIKYGKKQRQTVCYDFKPGSDGWCGVCIDGAEPFTYGFCAPGMPPPEGDDLITRVQPSSHWGFCSKLCSHETSASSTLQETRLSVLDNAACTLLNSSFLLFRPEIEFCGGRKLQFPEMKIYRRFRVRKNETEGNSRYTFKLIGVKKNMLAATKEHQKLGYYLGDTDSCQGDSGGPFYMFHGTKAYIVGVVSRGGQCAGFNQPGIYTNVVHGEWNKWIREEAKDGNC